MSCEAIHCTDTATIRYAIYPDGLDGPRVIAHVSDMALCELFGADGSEASLLEACKNHFNQIEAKALERYRETPFDFVLLETADLAAPLGTVRRNALPSREPSLSY